MIISVTQTRVPIVFARTVPQTTPTVTRTPGNQSAVPIVFARTVPQTTPTVTRTPGDLSLGSLKDVSVSLNVQDGDGIFFNLALNKFISSQLSSNNISLLDGGTY